MLYSEIVSMSGPSRSRVNFREFDPFALVAILFILASGTAAAQTYSISTFAGGGLPVNIPGLSASLYGPTAVAVDKSGNVFLSDDNTILRLDAATGILTLVAGIGTSGYSGDNGPATSAALSNPYGIAVDSAGNVYIADTSNCVVRKVSGGVITTVAGASACGFSGDNGPATSAQLDTPSGVALDSAGNLYIADTSNSRIRKVSGGVITTVAGNVPGGFSGDGGSAFSAALSGPRALAFDSAGNLYIADTGNGRVREVSATGTITTVAGNGTYGTSGDNGPATNAGFYEIVGIALDPAGDLYIADFGGTIREVSGGVIKSVVGNNGLGFSGDNGPVAAAQIRESLGVAVDSAGNVYIADTSNFRIRKISTGTINTIAGNGLSGFSGDNGPAASAELNYPAGIALDSAGDVYFTDTYSNRVRKVSGGIVTTVAGGGSAPGDNGPATSAQLNQPSGIAIDSAGNLYISEPGAYRVRKVTNGIITTVAGTGAEGFSGDNVPASSAALNGAYGLAVDSAGSLYIADGQFRVRKVSGGIITTVAGLPGTLGTYGDGGPATSADLYFPKGVAVDSSNNLYIADTRNGRIRKVSNGIITTVAGGGFSSSPNGGPATSAGLNRPTGVAVDSDGNIYIADTAVSAIWKVSGGIINAIVGGSRGGFSGDNGPAANAQIDLSDGYGLDNGIVADPSGKVYFTDTVNNRIRVLTPSAGPLAPYISGLSPASTAAGTGSFTLTINGNSFVSGSTVSWNGTLLASAFVGSGQLTATVPAALVATAGSANIVVTDSAGTSNTLAFTIQVSAKPAPSIFANGVVPLNSKATTIQPGEWVSIYGTNLASTTMTSTGNFPISLGGTSVTINGTSAYLLYVSSGQINLMAPDDTATGPVAVVVTTANGSATSTVTLGQFGPSFALLVDAQHVAGLIIRSDGSGAYGGGTYDILGPSGNSLGYATVAAKAGDVVELFGFGFGPTKPFVPAGQVFSSAAPTTNPVSLAINNVVVTPFFAGLSSAGVYQFNLIIPSGLGSGDVPLQGNVGDVQTPAGVVISLQ